MLHFMLPSSHFFFSFRYFFYKPDCNNHNGNLLTRILLHPHMLCQPLFRKYSFVALITIKLQILHRQSENRNFRNHDCIPQYFSIFIILSRFSFLLLTDSVVVSLIFTGPNDLCQLVHGCCS